MGQLQQRFLNWMRSMRRTQPNLTLDNMHDQLARLKEPFLREANQTAKQFSKKVREYNRKVIEQENQEQTNPEGDYYQTIEEEHAPVYPTPTVCIKKAQQEKNSVKLSQSIWQQWKPNIEEGLKNYADLLKNYDDIMHKKQRVKKMKEKPVIEDFRADERELVLEIYEELKDPLELTVSFSAIEAFFTNYDLFYYFYNIRPNRLKSLLTEYAKTHKKKLTKQQFLDFFLIERANVLECKVPTRQKKTGRCILGEDGWKKLKSIFDTLDTFGNEIICLKTFFQKIKSNPSSSFSLLSSQAIQFPDLERVYTLEKVFFDLENKCKFQSKVNWSTIQDTIVNFTHIEEPSLDKILMIRMERAQISKDSNYFMLPAAAIEIIKDIFQGCPKHYQSFVKTSFLVGQLLEIGILAPYMSYPVRPENFAKNTFIKLEHVLKNLSNDAPMFIDMDEMLEFISIKGQQNAQKRMKLYDKITSDSDRSDSKNSEQRRNERKLIKIRSLENIKKAKKRDRNKPFHQPTQIKEFNIFKRESPTIREKKVLEMIEEKDRIDQIELDKKFKANPIPVSLNSDRYLKYKKLLALKKQSILNKLNMKNESNQKIIQHMKINTKLLEEKKIPVPQERPTRKFEASPLPLHIAEELLPKIEAEKQERRKQLLEETKKRYEEVHWRNLRYDEKDDNSLLSEIYQMQQENRKCTPFKSSPVPNFGQLQRKFQEELQNKRLNRKVTEIKEFKLSSPKQKVKSYGISPQPHHIKKLSPPKSPKVQIKSTKKYEDLVAFNQARLAERELQQLQEIKEADERQIKQKNFAKFMRKFLGNFNSNTQMLKNKRDHKLKKFKEHVKDLENKTGEQLAEIYARVLQRPFLFEEASGKTRKPKVKKSKYNPVWMNKQTKMTTQHHDGYPYKDGLFEKEGSEYHPVESENLNQSF